MIASETRIFLMKNTKKGRAYQESLLKRLKSIGYKARRLESKDEIGVVAKYEFDEFFNGDGYGED